MLIFSETAQTKLKEMLADQDSSTTGLRLSIDQDDVYFEPVALNQLKPDEEPLRDKRTNFFVEFQGFLVVVERKLQNEMREAKVDYEAGGLLSGTFSLKMQEADPVLEKVDEKDPLIRQVRDFLNKEINPGLAMHGGFAELLNIQSGQAYLKFGGGCQGCSMIDITVKQGVETRLKEVFPQISGVVDYTDHAKGANPFFS